MTIIILVTGVLGFILLIFIIKLKMNSNWVHRSFKDYNFIVFGRKGSGKDVLFQHAINRINKAGLEYTANMDYGNTKNVIDIGKFSLWPNDSTGLINNEITKVKNCFDKENFSHFESDAGIKYPSHLDSILSKKYPWLPLVMGLSRQLWLVRFHMNTQALTRVWIKIREQADGYIKTLGTIKLPFLGLLTKFRFYELYETALAGIRPMKVNTLLYKKQEVRAMQADFDAKNGVIEEKWIFTPFKKLLFDTRYFKHIFFEEENDCEKLEEGRDTSEE